MSVKDQSLQYIDDSVIVKGEFLDDISSDQVKFSCLKIVVKCHKFIKWIQEELRGTKLQSIQTGP